MKKLALFLILFVTFLNVKSQDLMNLRPTGYVNDYQNLFTKEQKDTLEKIMSDYEKKTSIQFCLVTSADFDVANVRDLAQKWGVGQKEQNNGFMIFFSHSDIKGQSHYDERTGYGLEAFLPDGKLKQLENEIFPRTLYQGQYYDAYKEFIIACQDEIGYEGYDMLVKQKEIKDAKSKAAVSAFFYGVLKFLLLLLFLGGIGYLIYLQYKKRQKFLELKSKISIMISNIADLRSKFGDLPEYIQSVYISMGDIFKNGVIDGKVVTEENLTNLNYIYNTLLDYRQTVNSIDNSISLIENFKSNIQQYLTLRYAYCGEYLKNDIDNLISDAKIIDLKKGEYDKKRMDMLTTVYALLNKKLNTFLEKTVKIKNIVSDKSCINTTIQDLKKSYADYIQKKNILSTAKIGKRYSSLVDIDFDNKLNLISTYILDSFNYLEKSEYDQAVNSYGNYITTISVINSGFSAVTNLYNEYNKSVEYLKNKQSELKNSVSDVDGKISKSGVSYYRKSDFENLKSDISKCKKDEDYDVILAAASLGVILSSLSDVYSRIKSDISSHEYSQSSSSYPSSSSSSSSSSFGGFSGGSFGGGGSGGSF